MARIRLFYPLSGSFEIDCFETPGIRVLPVLSMVPNIVGRVIESPNIEYRRFRYIDYRRYGLSTVGPKARFGVQPVIVQVLRSRCIAIAMRSSERISNDPDADSGSAELGRGDRGCRERWPGDGRPVGDDGPGPRACRRGRRSSGLGTPDRRGPEIGENPGISARGAFLRNVNFG